MENQYNGYRQYSAKVITGEAKKKCFLFAEDFQQAVRILQEWYGINSSTIIIVSVSTTKQGIVIETGEVIEDGEIYSAKFAAKSENSEIKLKVLVEASNASDADRIARQEIEQVFEEPVLEEIQITSFDEMIPLEFSKQHGS